MLKLQKKGCVAVAGQALGRMPDLPRLPGAGFRENDHAILGQQVGPLHRHRVREGGIDVGLIVVRRRARDGNEVTIEFDECVCHGAWDRRVIATSSARDFTELRNCTSDSPSAWRQFLRHRSKALPPEYTTFSPWVYSIDMMLPVGGLGQKQDWSPEDRELVTQHENFPWALRIATWPITAVEGSAQSVLGLPASLGTYFDSGKWTWPELKPSIRFEQVPDSGGNGRTMYLVSATDKFPRRVTSSQILLGWGVGSC